MDVSFPEPILEKLENRSEETGRSKAEIIRSALVYYFNDVRFE